MITSAALFDWIILFDIFELHTIILKKKKSPQLHLFQETPQHKQRVTSQMDKRKFDSFA